MDPLQNPIIAKVLVKDHHRYEMERCNHNNNLLCVLLKLHQMGVSDNHLNRIYHTITQSMTPLLMPTVSKLRLPLNADNWSHHLGDQDLYKAYLLFFDEQIRNNGIKFVTERYFYNGRLELSIGAQRQPIIHLALGIQYNLPEVVAQALAYLSSTYKEASFLINRKGYDDDDEDNISEDSYDDEVSGRYSAYEIVVEQIRYDPRFSVLLTTKYKNNRQYIIDTVLRNQQALLRMYIDALDITDVRKSLSELRILAYQIMKRSQAPNDSRILIESIMALDVLYPNRQYPVDIIRLQFLALICSYIALGLPSLEQTNISMSEWLDQFLESGESNDTISILITLKEVFEGVNQSLIYDHVLSFF